MVASSVRETTHTLQNLESGRTGIWYLRGHVVFQCLATLQGAGIDFFEELEARGALDVRAFAREKNLNGNALEAVARYLYGLGVLDRDERGRYSAGADILEEDLATVEMFHAYSLVFHHLAALLKNEKVYGRDLCRHTELDVKATARICKNSSYTRVAELIKARGARRVLDLGCGSAELLIQLCRRNPELHGYGIDISPDAVAYARSRVDEEGLGSRIKVAAGDIFNLRGDGFLTAEEKRGVDLIVSTAVFHEFTYEGVGELVRALSGVKSEFDGVELILCEALEQADEVLRRNPTAALEHHLFHRLSLQGIASPEEWRPAFAGAGYILRDEIPLPHGGVIFVLG